MPLASADAAVRETIAGTARAQAEVLQATMDLVRVSDEVRQIGLGLEAEVRRFRDAGCN